MTDRVPRVAYFPDSFHEVNGVAHTSRHFEAFARRRNLPFLCVRAGNRAQATLEEDHVWSLELPRGFLSFALEKDLRFDPAFLRHLPLIGKTLERFKPDLIHITGPSEIGMIGAWFAHHLNLPLAASWHTNIHEYAARRSKWFLRLLPRRLSAGTGQKIEDLSMAAFAWFYSKAKVLYAPNPELCRLLERTTGRPCSLMPRGVEAELFHPGKRKRKPKDRDQVLGFVGRLSVEKNVALLAQVQEELERLGHKSFRFLIVGHGCRGRSLQECSRARRSPRLTRIWTSSSFPRTPIPLVTWCWRLWPAECPRSSLLTADPARLSATAKQAALCPTASLPPQ